MRKMMKMKMTPFLTKNQTSLMIQWHVSNILFTKGLEFYFTTFFLNSLRSIRKTVNDFKSPFLDVKNNYFSDICNEPGYF